MEKQNNEKETQEFHFGDWTSSSENGSQEGSDSDTICPISLNDLINIEKKSQKRNQKQDDDTDFIIPSLADTDNQEEKQKNKEDIFNTSVSKILYDFTQNATVLGFDSSFTNQSDDEKVEYTSQTVKNKINSDDDNDEKLKSFTSLVKSEQTFVKLHQKCFSSESDSDSDIFVVTNNEEVLEPDSDSSTENTFEEYQLSQIKQSKSQIYESKEKEKNNKSLNLTNLQKNKVNQIKKSEIKPQNSSMKKTEENYQSKIQKIESPQKTDDKIQNENNKKLEKSSTNGSLILSTKKNISKVFNSSSRKNITLELTSSDSSSSIDLDSSIKSSNQNKLKNQKNTPRRSVLLINRKRHLNTLSNVSFNDNSYSSTSSYSYSDDEKIEKPSNYIDSLDSTLTIKNTSKSQKDQNQQQKAQIENSKNQQKNQTIQKSEIQNKDDIINHKENPKKIENSQIQQQTKTKTKKENDQKNQTIQKSEIQIEDDIIDHKENPKKIENSQIQQQTKTKTKKENDQKNQTIQKSGIQIEDDIIDHKENPEKIENSQNQQQTKTKTLKENDQKNQTIQKSEIQIEDDIIDHKENPEKIENSQNQQQTKTKTLKENDQKKHNKQKTEIQVEDNNKQNQIEKSQIQKQIKAEIDKNQEEQLNQDQIKNSQIQQQTKMKNEKAKSKPNNESQSQPNHSSIQNNQQVKIKPLQHFEYDDTIVYPKPKTKSSSSNTQNRQKAEEIKNIDAPGVYPIVPPIILSPISNKDKVNNVIPISNDDEEFNSPTEKQNQFELNDDNKDTNLNLNQQQPQKKEIKEPSNISLSNEDSKDSMFDINSSLEKSDKKSKIINSSSENIVKIGSFKTNKNRKKKKLLSDDSDDNQNKSDNEKWFDDDPCNPSDLLEDDSISNKSSFIDQKETEKVKINKIRQFKINKEQNEEKEQKTKKEQKNEEKKQNEEKEQNEEKKQKTKKEQKNEEKEQNEEKKQNEEKEQKSEEKEQKSEEKEQNEGKKQNDDNNKIIFDMDQIDVPVFSFFEFISEPSYFNDLNFTSLVLTINGVFNLPPPSGVSQLDLVLHFQNMRCAPIVINLKSARFRAGKYDAIDSQVLVRIPLFCPSILPRSFYCTQNSGTINSIDEIFGIRKSCNDNDKSSKTNLIEINSFNSNGLFLTFELMGNGKRLCGSNLCLLENQDDKKVTVASLGKHFLRLMQRPNMKCELKKGEKEPLIEVQINKVDDRDEKQMRFLPFFSIIHVFFVDSVVAYRQVIERYRLQKANGEIDQKEFNLLAFFAPASSDLASMKKFAKSFKDAMKKMPKDKRSDDDKLKLFVDILRGSVIQINSKNNQKGMLPFSTIQVSELDS